MKLPKINKQTIRSFFLHHTEKLIILTSLALMGWFFWSGYKTEVFDETTPQQLKKMAEQAGDYIDADNAWTEIMDSRQAVESLPTILSDEGIDASDLEVRIPSVAVKSLAPRSDPRLRPVTDLIATPFTAPLFLATRGRKKDQDPFDDIPFATEANAEEVDEDDDRDRRRVPVRRTPRRREKDDEPEIRIPGENVPLVQHHESMGLRPGSTRLNKDDRIFLLNGVAVAGIVNVKQQYADYQNSFAFGAGYYPKRDRPIYQYVQIERAEVVEGKAGEWKDISKNVHEDQTRLYPTAAPEVVAADNYDEILSGVIPPITLVDYKPLSLHPKVQEREFPSPDDEDSNLDGGDEQSATPGDLFGATSDDPEDQVARRVGPGGNRRSNATRRQTSRRGSTARRAGSDRRPYDEAMADEEEPAADNKLVRFFDLQTAPGKTYQYRVRLWLTDPNNNPEEGSKRNRRGAGRSMDMGMDEMDMGMDMDMDMDMDMGMDMDRGGGGTGRGGSQLGADGKPKKQYKEIPITNNMKSPDSRARLARAREDADPDDATRFIYYVSEAYGEGEGEDKFTEIKVPRRAKIDVNALFDLDELRFARPTAWSDPVSVTISTASRAEIAAGSVTPPKTDRVGNSEIPDSEPIANLAVSIWSKEYKTLVPTKQEVRRGELLNYVADSHLLNPLTWAVHKVEGEVINTDMVLVDTMGGQKVDTGRKKELMEYSLPGEMLVLNPDGKFELHNDFGDQGDYRHLLFIHDDSNEVGEVKKPKDRDRRGGRGGRGDRR